MSYSFCDQLWGKHHSCLLSQLQLDYELNQGRLFVVVVFVFAFDVSIKCRCVAFSHARPGQKATGVHQLRPGCLSPMKQGHRNETSSSCFRSIWPETSLFHHVKSCASLKFVVKWNMSSLFSQLTTEVQKVKSSILNKIHTNVWKCPY